MNICFIDFETTGIDVFKDSPIEIGCVLVNESNEILKSYYSYIHPRTKRRFTSSSIKIHGIEEELLQKAKSQKEVLAEFFKIMGFDFRFAGWNINFDVTFFRRMCHLNSYMRFYNKIYHRHIDIQSIVHYTKEINLLPNELNSLDDLIHFFNLNRSIKHNAMEDAELTLEVYKKLLLMKF